jgi:uncharacterized protein with HEPN domain
MAEPTLAERLSHMLEAIEHIISKTVDVDQNAFANDRFTQLGVERCLEIISEASRHIPNELKTEHPSIPWRRIADIGNRIRHAYHAVDSEIIWLISKDDLPDLKAVLLVMMSSES